VTAAVVGEVTKTVISCGAQYSVELYALEIVM
jgi:hypothetical protein